MKVKVIKLFKDKFDKETLYQVGEVHDFEDERAQDLIERGLAEEVEPQATDPLKETVKGEEPDTSEDKASAPEKTDKSTEPQENESGKENDKEVEPAVNEKEAKKPKDKKK